LTYPSRIWPRPNPSQDSARRSGPAAHRSPGGIAILFILAFLLAALPVRADTTIRIASTQSSYIFGESLTFAIEAESDRPIVEAILFYGRDGERLVRRIYPDFTPGTHLRTQHVEELEAGQFAPGTILRSWWQLTTDDGTTQISEPGTFAYDDHHHDWKIIAGERVDLYWYGSDKDNAQELLEAADGAVARLEEEIGISVEQRPRVYVYNNRQEMSKALSRRSESYDPFVLTLGVKVDESTVLLLGPHRHSRLTLAHELSHVVVGMATDNPYTALPRWLDEGLAMYAEEELPADNAEALKRAIKRDDLLSIRSMTSYSGRADLVDLYYGEVYSVVDFMLSEYGSDKMRELLTVFSEGIRQEEALLRVYGFGLGELDTRWRASLGLGPREIPTGETPSPATGERPRPESKSVCSYSVGALLLPLLGGVFCLGARKLGGAG